MELNALLRLMVKERASDLFLKTGATPAFRVDGAIRRDLGAAQPAADVPFMDGLLQSILDKRDLDTFQRDGEVDTAYEIEGLARFRVNVFRQRGRVGFVFRHVPTQVPSMEVLGLPSEQLQKLCSRQRGLVLITGVAGSGKSTCLAAMVDYINTHFQRHIITIEDPIEFVHSDKLSVVEQRELGIDTQSFAGALKHCVRQSPDVILIGEMRDQETMEAALNAAETGHLVLSTLHTVNAVQTVERIMGYFPPHLHDLVRMQLALVLEGVVSLRLLPRRSKVGRVPAVEVMMATPTIRDLLQQGKTRQIPATLRESAYFGAQTFGQSIKSLLDRRIIVEEDAMSAADNPEELKMELRGIARGGDLRRG